jgi:hypothetical protein
MALALQALLDMHVAAGAVALLVFWIPLVTKKAGPAHRRAGRVYVVAAATLAITGLLLCVPLVSSARPGRWHAGVFLAYVSVFAGASAMLGVRALRTRRRTRASRSPIDVVPPSLLVVGGIALAAFGVGQSTVLYVFFGVLGIVLGLAHLRFWLRPPVHGGEWFLAHMSGMGTSSIATVTAFLVVNARRLGMRTFDFGLWAGPIAALAIGLTLWRRHYATRFAQEGATRGARG